LNRSDLEEELSYLRRSIEDLKAEHSAGDVSDRDYERLLARYETQAMETEHSLGAQAPASVEPGTPSGRSGSGGNRIRTVLSTRRARLVTGWAAFSCFVAAAVLLGMVFAGVGPFASTPPLSVQARVQIMLAEASVLGSRGEITQALATYDRVLELRPTQPVALAEGGWLARLSGLSQHDGALVRNGDAEIEAAVRADPGYALARAYDGVMLYRDRGQSHLGVSEFQAMLEDHPSAALLWSVRSDAVAAFHAADVATPRQIADATKPASA
jgi:hypothetical protein